MADDKKNIGPEAEKSGEAPQKKNTNPKDELVAETSNGCADSHGIN